MRQLQLLWKQTFGSAADRLTDPAILGPFITHRGIKELVFVHSASDTVHAVDADLGTVFWSRHLTSGNSDRTPTPCAAAMPVMLPSPDKPKDPSMPDDDNFSDGNKSLYVVAADSTLYAIRPSTGGDFFPSRQFLPPGQRAINLSAANDTLYAAFSPGCGVAPDQIATLPISVAAGQSNVSPLSTKLKAFEDTLIRRPAQNGTHLLADTLVAFTWQGRDLFAARTNDGHIQLMDAAARTVLASVGVAGSSGNFATWQDPAGIRWFCATGPHLLQAFQLVTQAGSPGFNPSWISRSSYEFGPPVVANGIVYSVSSDEKTPRSVYLHAFESATGAEIYTSQKMMTARSPLGSPAMANGHLCFSAGNQLFCFGLPVQQ